MKNFKFDNATCCKIEILLLVSSYEPFKKIMALSDMAVGDNLTLKRRLNSPQILGFQSHGIGKVGRKFSFITAALLSYSRSSKITFTIVGVFLMEYQ